MLYLPVKNDSVMYEWITLKHEFTFSVNQGSTKWRRVNCLNVLFVELYSEQNLN
jgi:hypothetical protein